MVEGDSRHKFAYHESAKELHNKFGCAHMPNSEKDDLIVYCIAAFLTDSENLQLKGKLQFSDGLKVIINTITSLALDEDNKNMDKRFKHVQKKIETSPAFNTRIKECIYLFCHQMLSSFAAKPTDLTSSAF